MSLSIPANSSGFFRFPPVGRHIVLWSLWGTLLVAAFASQATALVRFDFEQKYYRHPDRQVWDFSIIRPDSIYHIFYHTIHEQTPNAVYGDTIWHATSPDLKHWGNPMPILTVDQGPWDQGAIWAPDVFWDELRNRWTIAYTGCDASYNQTICMAYSYNLNYWVKVVSNPVVEPDTNLYVWDRNDTWSDFRDPFVYRQDTTWHMLVTAEQNLGAITGVLYHGT